MNALILLGTALWSLSGNPSVPSVPASPTASAPEAALRKGLPGRLDAASSSLLGRGYLLGPLGEGDPALGDPRPRIRLDSFDCVTYVETSLALALSPDTSRLLPILDSIRYRDGRPAWRERNHFFEGDWLPRNHRWVRPVRFPEDTLVVRRLARHAFYARRGVDVPDTTVELRLLWRDRAVARFGRPSDSSRIRGVALVGKVEGYPVLHTGFLVERPGRLPLLRHASQAGTVREQPLADYLGEKTKFVGVLVWDFADPAEGGSARPH